MKLRNKKTGEIFDGDVFSFGDMNFLAELTAEWEDYDEPKNPKDHRFIQSNGIVKISQNLFGDTDYFEDMANEIGNLFATKEEAEKAVEKLKAWKRLKDKGFRFDGYDVAHNSNGDLCGQLFYNAGYYCIEDVEKDLDLLFGGEE